MKPGLNERAPDLAWTKQNAARVKSDAAGFGSAAEQALYDAIQIVVSDEVEVGTFGDEKVSDAALRSAVAAVAYHYNTAAAAAGNFKKLAEQLDEEVWNSEAQATFGNAAYCTFNNTKGPSVAGPGPGGTNSPLEMGNTIIKGFVASRRTHFVREHRTAAKTKPKPENRRAWPQPKIPGMSPRFTSSGEAGPPPRARCAFLGSGSDARACEWYLMPRRECLRPGCACAAPGDAVNHYEGCPVGDAACSRNGEWVESVESALGDWRVMNGCGEEPTELSRISWTPGEEGILGVSSWKRRPLESGTTARKRSSVRQYGNSRHAVIGPSRTSQLA